MGSSCPGSEEFSDISSERMTQREQERLPSPLPGQEELQHRGRKYSVGDTLTVPENAAGRHKTRGTGNGEIAYDQRQQRSRSPGRQRVPDGGLREERERGRDRERVLSPSEMRAAREEIELQRERVAAIMLAEAELRAHHANQDERKLLQERENSILPSEVRGIVAERGKNRILEEMISPEVRRIHHTEKDVSWERGHTMNILSEMRGMVAEREERTLEREMRAVSPEMRGSQSPRLKRERSRELENNMNLTLDLRGVTDSRDREERERGRERERNRMNQPTNIRAVREERERGRTVSPPAMRGKEVSTRVRSLSQTRGSSPQSTPSPKKRQLPQIPPQAQGAGRDRVTQDLEERARQMKMRMKVPGGGGMSDSEAGYRSHSRDRRESSMDRYYREGRMQGREPREVTRTRRIHDPYGGEMGDEPWLSDGSETSVMSEMSKVSTISVRSTQSEKPRRKLSEFASKMESRGPPSRRNVNRTQSSGDLNSSEQADGSMSDSAVSSGMTERRKRRPSIGVKMAALMGLSKKSSSASQLSATDSGTKKSKSKSTFQRSEEIGTIPPGNLGGMGSHGDQMAMMLGHGSQSPLRGRMIKQASKDSTDGSIGSISSDSSSMWLPQGMRVGPEGQFGDFVDNLGPGQLVGRQVLGLSCLGDIQLSLSEKKGHLEVEVIRARGLQQKSGAKILPAPYVKVYLMEGKNCAEKQKTIIARRTLDPLYQQQIVFNEDYHGKVVQVTVWGDYGRMERKVFMGVAQILLDDLDLSNIVIGWYKLFPASSLVNAGSSGSGGGSGGSTRRNSSSSLDSQYNSASSSVR
ncbi:regulating synaptic membrane exocytosis protein 2-like isoform X2 [Lingula anatina]|uniref:Regulating synaptic membrane exocytosis protein 2-like isoform X2 n=1 Tax=Lingula anatina TaxID=7574 RepID=A0A1S3KGN6_LINAN|nr:regulating synaptic membrane exocytosis protein 2-like isoform X2 [Lingula anatina]|eukprot:XP_013421619.1 regulating synaptic membrane exocytosis protein 2-like isoform X2 [Lingula anatina]